MLQLFRKRKFRKQKDLTYIKAALEEEFKFDDSAEISIVKGQVKFYYELFDHSFAGSIQSEGFTALISPDLRIEVTHYKILHDEFVDMSRYDRNYRADSIENIIEILWMIIEGEEEYY
ncbi:MAG: hypothetical protein ACTSPI_02800 [Candidatus Heimdallarchaeaceae archaeon]